MKKINNIKTIYLDGVIYHVNFYMPKYVPVELRDRTVWVLDNSVLIPYNVDKWRFVDLNMLFREAKAKNLISIPPDSKREPTKKVRCIISPNFMVSEEYEDKEIKFIPVRDDH